MGSWLVGNSDLENISFFVVILCSLQIIIKTSNYV